ncbi:MBL fold metallo-hydrolase [soil metagenome]
MKRFLKWAGIVLLVLLVGVGGLFYSVFGSNLAVVDGQEIEPGITTVKDGFVSVFVLDVGPGKVVLVDTGNDKTAKATLDALTRRGLTAASVAAILLTHGHPDHTSGCRAFPDVPVYALEVEIPIVGDACKVTHPLHDGDVVDIGDLHVEVFSVPGHTVGSAVYLTRGVLFFGDSAGANKSGELTRAVRLFSKDSAENVASLKALDVRLKPRSGEIKKLAFAHTGPLTGLGPLDTFASQP